MTYLLLNIVLWGIIVCVVARWWGDDREDDDLPDD